MAAAALLLAFAATFVVATLAILAWLFVWAWLMERQARKRSGGDFSAYLLQQLIHEAMVRSPRWAARG